MAEKMRVHILANELNVPSKMIIEKCRAEGIDSVKNHMSTLSAGLHATIMEWFSEGSHDTTVETSARVDLKKVQRKRKSAEQSSKAKDAAPDEKTEVIAEAQLETTVVGKSRKQATSEAEPDEQPRQSSTTAVLEAEREIAPSTVEAEDNDEELIETLEVEKPFDESSSEGETEESAPEIAVADAIGTAGDTQSEAGAEYVEGVEEAAKESVGESSPTQADQDSVRPAGPQNVPTPAKLRGPRVVRYEAPEADAFHPPRRRQRSDDGERGDYVRPAAESLPVPGIGDSPGGRGATRKKGRGSGRRDGAGDGERVPEWRNRDLEERRERLEGATGRRIHHRKALRGGLSQAPVSTGPKTKATVHEPIRMKEFCSETGLNFIQLFKALRTEFEMNANVNMILPTETAQLLALHFGIELEVVRAKTKLDELKEEALARERNYLSPRPPVVAMLGHVDHGKTSLLDAIRKTHVVEGEDGGITQHIGSYHLETERGSVTFLDTPGHEAFTAMRARGAQLTDVVVLVVAADDGLMPQTIEAINHAKAAKVSVVVALNKIDLGEQNKMKIYGQLAEHGLTPAGDWGGEIDVLETSATTGRGVKELVEHLADLSSVLELKADPTLPAVGTVIEAETKPGVGSVVRVLIQEGTLRVGDIVVCGNACGKVRALLGDRMTRIMSARPSIPVEIWGLDDVPTAGDRLYQVENMQRASEIAAETKQQRLETSRVQSTKVKSLEELFTQREEGEIPELNLIIKADVDGSLAALRQSLEQLPTDEVRLSIRHAAVGPVNDSDILLAATINGIVIAYRVDVPTGVRRLTDQHSVDVRSYKVIYAVIDEVKKALEGLLAPEERIETRAILEIRETFNIRKVGVIAGCYVTSGSVDRNHLVKVIRDGVVVRDDARIASLKRFKDDAKEVRSGLECGIRLEGYNDLHIGDVMEAYEIVKIARML